LLRPVAPFFELWVRSSGNEQPLTLKWLQDNDSSLAAIRYSVTAANRKAARRSGDPSCAFAATIQVAGNDHTRHALLASSSGATPLVSPTAPIPLGSFQVIQPTAAIAMGVDLSVVRVRFTPATGQVYGPPSASTARESDGNAPQREHTIVPPNNRILNPNTSWLQYTSNDRDDNPEPSDTYDGADDASRRNRSFGVVDDTCDVILQASLTAGSAALDATARVFSGPPDFAPDRRPFYSLADELIDRNPPPREEPEALQDSVERLGDLFQRVYETSSLANLDMMRNAMLPRNSRGLQNFPGLPALTVGESMTRTDTPYFDKDQDLSSPPSSHEELPYSSLAAQTHAPMADADDLALFLRNSADQVRRLIRPAYPHFKDFHERVRADQKPDSNQRDPRITRDTLHDMRMPPYMRDSDATPLSLNRRQYEFLLQTLDRLQAKTGKLATAEFNLAQDHLSRVVNRRQGELSKAVTRKRKSKATPAKSAKRGKGRKK
jgi:hypothetical protein